MDLIQLHALGVINKHIGKSLSVWSVRRKRSFNAGKKSSKAARSPCTRFLTTRLAFAFVCETHITLLERLIAVLNTKSFFSGVLSLMRVRVPVSRAKKLPKR